jgi:hypothetical protein
MQWTGEQIEFTLGDIGHIRYYLAPKIDDEEAGAGANGVGDE